MMSGMSVQSLIAEPSVTIDVIAEHLDGLDADRRWQELSILSRSEQRALYEKAAAAPAITAEHFHGGAPPLQAVIHEGLNTLPTPKGVRRFQKRFARGNGAEELFGYNEGVTRKAIGPGYFVAGPTAGNAQWESRGAIVIDYFRVPTGPVPSGWPKVVENREGPQRFVYHGTRDFMRRVSAHVSIGAAYKGERPLDHYFVLCRIDN